MYASNLHTVHNSECMKTNIVQDGFYPCHSFLLHVLPFAALYHVNSEFIFISCRSLGISVSDNKGMMQPKCISQIECGLALSVFSSTMIRIITVVKMWWTHSAAPRAHQILTTGMTHIVVDKNTDNTKPHSICFLPQYQCQRNCFFQNMTH